MMLFTRWLAIFGRSRNWRIKATLTGFCSKPVWPFVFAMPRPAATPLLAQKRKGYVSRTNTPADVSAWMKSALTCSGVTLPSAKAMQEPAACR